MAENYRTPSTTMTIAALQQSDSMYEQEEMRQKAKNQAKYGPNSDVHKMVYETYKEMKRKQDPSGYKDLL